MVKTSMCKKKSWKSDNVYFFECGFILMGLQVSADVKRKTDTHSYFFSVLKRLRFFSRNNPTPLGYFCGINKLRCFAKIDKHELMMPFLRKT